ncbi:ATP-binding protein [Dyadobacter sp. CY343]|uniref:sensor histidine kinase n=1 Tax=Dyadobacter sp. CY343 TaxID=2907299 RepID=UPI001F3FFD6A|nr:PAS domain-containing sensor histidine kinase [Dyadobacter sp. CY343]MCE7060879.1 PAS domain-containing sensor histidine kinase [Dyadobacter sp. CY343]
MKPDSTQHVADQLANIALCKTPLPPINAAAPLSDQISTFFSSVSNTSDFPARWYCGSWSDFHGWLYILSDIGIGAAYFTIPVLLLVVIRRRNDSPFQRIFLLFIAFILLCGLTHLIDATIFWWPAYRLSALLRLATAIVSIVTVFALYKMLPLISSLRSVRDLECEIVKRKEVEEKLAASEFLLSEAGRISEVGGWETDLITKVRTWSKTVYDILELPDDYPLNQLSLYSHVQEPYKKIAEAAVTAAIETGREWDEELVATTLTGKSVWVRSTGRPLFDENGKVTKLRGIFMNIDRYKNAELALNKSLELTTQNNVQLKNFTHILSHNIRNHATNMVLLSTLVDPEKLDEENALLFEKMKDVSNGLNSTLEDLSKAIKIKESVVQSELIDLKTITEKVLGIFHTDLNMNNAVVDIYFEETVVSFPRVYLESIITNLVSNAIKYRKPDSPLHIQLKCYQDQDEKTVLECRDNGLGIDLALHGKKMFGLYKTFHNRSDAHGVGLFLVKTQIESQGGKIEVESEPGVGSAFKIIFNG